MTIFFTSEDYFKKMNELGYESPNTDIVYNAEELLKRVNLLLHYLQYKMVLPDDLDISSGWRHPKYNATVHGSAPNSKHLYGLAVDLNTEDIAEYLHENPKVLKAYELYMESPLDTQTWTHLQSVPPKSGSLIFRR